MKQKFEKIEKHFYKRSYQVAGKWRTTYYAVFTTWQGQRRSFPLGDKLPAARKGLEAVTLQNLVGYNFAEADREKVEARIKEKAMTVTEYLDKYLDVKKDTAGAPAIKSYLLPLKRLLGSLPLQSVNKMRLMEYQSRRLAECIMRHGKPVEGKKVKGATVNREISCLKTALALAYDEGLCDEPPRVKKKGETPRDRVLSDQEFGSIIEASPRWLRRILIFAIETALDRSALLALTWDRVTDGLIKISRPKTGIGQRVGISPAIRGVLDELKGEVRSIHNPANRVFTKDGLPVGKEILRHAFDKALRDAKVEGFQFRDFRHCCRTRWAAGGLPFEVAEIGLGHTLPGLSQRYANLTDDHIRDAFAEMLQRREKPSRDSTGT